MARLLFFLFSADGVIAVLLVAGVAVLARPRSAWARRFLLVAIIGYSFASIYAVPASIAGLLARGFHPFGAADVPGGSTAIILLAGGTNTIDGWKGARIGVAQPTTAARVLETSRVFRLMPDALVISSGGAEAGAREQIPEATTMREMLVQLGVPPAKIVTETESRDTHDEAVLIAPMLRQRGVQHLVLVTSEVHMPRSLSTFRSQGWDAVPAIAPDPGYDAPWPGWILPSANGLELTSQVVHELFGIPYYWARGWSRS